MSRLDTEDKNTDLRESTVEEQASELERLLPALMRRMFTLDPSHLVAELPVAQLRVCSILQGGPRMFSAISMELGISVSAATQIADRLERAGLVDRVPGVDDRRTKYLRLSDHGEKMMTARRLTRIDRAIDTLQRLDGVERRAVLDALEKLLEAATASVPQAPSSDIVTVRQEQ